MPNLIFSLPPIASVPPRPPPESCGALAAQPCLAPIPAVPPASTPPAIPPPEESVTPSASRQSPRCAVKGCVFPAPYLGHPECHYHELQQAEGALFQSHQPSHLLTLHMPLGVPDYELDDSRYRDRKRQAAERESFLLEETGDVGS